MSNRPSHWRNTVQTVLLLAAMGVLWGVLGWLLAGPEWMAVLVVFGIAGLLATMRLAPALILSMYRARPLPASRAPALHALLDELCRRAGLSKPPALYYMPSSSMSAFSVGGRVRPAVVLSDGLLRALGWRELTGVLAHEVGHLKHRDVWVMALADLVSRMTHALALAGQLLLWISLPLWLVTGTPPSWPLVLLLLLAPGISALLQLALSRQREYDADLTAVELTGDPAGLANALQRLERDALRWVDYLGLPGRRVPEPSLLRTHPPTRERVERLLALRQEGGADMPPVAREGLLPADLPPVAQRPRRRLSGVWY